MFNICITKRFTTNNFLGLQLEVKTISYVLKKNYKYFLQNCITLNNDVWLLMNEI